MIYNKRQQEIIDFASKNRNFQTKDVFELIGKKFDVERLTIVRDLQKLKKQKILKQKGAGRGVYYNLEKEYELDTKNDIKKDDTNCSKSLETKKDDTSSYPKKLDIKNKEDSKNKNWICDNELAIFQAENGAIELKSDFKKQTVWANLDQISFLFKRDKSVISKHIKNIFNEKELDEKSTVAFFAIVQKEGKRNVSRNIEYFNLDLIISVGYRVNSKTATSFRKWATKTLKQYITKGFTINKKIVERNYKDFLKTVEDIKILSKDNQQITSDSILELIKTFSHTWLNLESYDRQDLPKIGDMKKRVSISSFELHKEIEVFKKELIAKKEATQLFAQEIKKDSLGGILGNVGQSLFGKDAYETVEQKAAHLFYFIVKNHPFTDGNKRTGAFSFIWFLQKSGFDFRERVSPETLTALTLLIAESNPKDKEKMVGLVLLILKKGLEV